MVTDNTRPLDGRVVMSAGRAPCDVMLVGEAPGREEAYRGRPFVGKSGIEQETYLNRHNLTAATWYRTNVVKLYQDGNPDPTPELIDEWTPVLEDEVSEVKPKLVIAVGRYAARWFLGDKANLDIVHGLPHRAGDFDETRSKRAGGAVVLPIYHPAAGFYDPDIKALCAWDYEQVAETLKKILSRRTVEYRRDEHKYTAKYLDVTGKEMAALMTNPRPSVFGFDTEGTPRDPWSLQIALREGGGVSLRRSQPDFDLGIAALQSAVDKGTIVAIHNAMYDIEMARVMGLELRDSTLWDTMYAAYLLRLEPQGLKALAYRWCGMEMSSYEETVGNAGADKQIEYLLNVMEHTWPKPEERLVTDNAGQAKVYKPQALDKRVEKIIKDYSDKPDVDLAARWSAVDDALRHVAEKVFGPFPEGTLDDIPLERAINYSCRDSDATLRLYNVLVPVLEKRGLTTLMAQGMKVIPIFEEMQSTGMHASRSHFAKLQEDMITKMDKLQLSLSYNYFHGKAFNPGSPLHVEKLMGVRGLEGAKKTSTGKMSTGKKSIEGLKFTDKAIAQIIEWRECQKIKTAFCEPIVGRLDEGGDDLQIVRCQLKPTRVQTRRLAAANPNFLAIPARSDLSKRVRDGFQCPPGQVFGGWDLSMIEMKVAAFLAGDELMIKEFNKGWDVHSETAIKVFHLDPTRKWNEAERKWVYPGVDKMKHRNPAKTAGFGILNGLGGPGLYDLLRMSRDGGSWDVDKCTALIEGWMGVYKGISAFIDACKKEVRRKGVVQDMWGMLRYLPGAWSDDMRVRAEAERTASNHKIQGGAQGMIQNSMRWIDSHVRVLQRDGFNVQWVMQIHDEIILRFDEELWDVMNDIVTEGLTKHHGVKGMPMPVECEGHMSKKWGDLK